MALNSSQTKFDAIIIGSGFSGSILGWILAKQGWRIAIVDRATHPRFAIGESSTPTADFLLAYLADRWSLLELRPLVAWGTWKESYPNIDCGKKRGFTYLGHQPGLPFIDDPAHRRSMMVAASQTDFWSDTHWMRSDVDHFLAKHASRAGCELIEKATIVSALRDSEWNVQISQHVNDSESVERTLKSRWLIDAGGGGDFSEKWLGNAPDDQWMKTQTFSVFGHFDNVGSFNPILGQSTEPDPIADFFVDDSAQHHVTEDGWLWMLRFDSGITSVGAVLPLKHRGRNFAENTDKSFGDWLQRYRSIYEMMKLARLLQPVGGVQWSNRLSRCRKRAVGDGWVMLPTAYGFVDPLHSTGIAHALSGVLRVAELFARDGAVDRATSSRWVTYGQHLRQEIEWLDLLVGGCYESLPSFDAFCAFASWYFVAAIQFEQTMARDPANWPEGYMLSDCHTMKSAAIQTYPSAHLAASSTTFSNVIRSAIQPWNRVGLLDSLSGRRIPHTAPPKYANR